MTEAEFSELLLVLRVVVAFGPLVVLVGRAAQSLGGYRRTHIRHDEGGGG